MATVEMQKAFLGACFASSDATAREILVRAGVAAADIESIVKPRFWLYRRLVRGNVVDVMHDLLERTRRRMDALAPGEIDAAFTSFLEQVGPRTHHLRDVPAEFVAWVVPRWECGERFAKSTAELPGYLPDFARFESAQFCVGTRPFAPPPVTDLHVERPLVLHGSLALLTTQYVVHELDASTDDAPLPPREGETHYAIYRDAEHQVRVLLLTPFVHAFAVRAMAGEALGAALSGAAAESALAADEVSGELAKLLADWAERGILLGAAT